VLVSLPKPAVRRIAGTARKYLEALQQSFTDDHVGSGSGDDNDVEVDEVEAMRAAATLKPSRVGTLNYDWKCIAGLVVRLSLPLIACMV
jgi:hypothetical protein